MVLNNTVSAELQAILAAVGIETFTFQPTTGGCINRTGIVSAAKEKLFVKWNEAAAYPGMLAAESLGLKALASCGSVRVPKVIQCGVAAGHQYLILECIRSGSRSSGFWKVFAEELARIHQNTSDSFGLDDDNYIGSLPQQNKRHTHWPSFFIEERLRPQIKLACDKALLPKDLVNMFDAFLVRLPALLTEEKPSLLHGDLWAGNLMVDERGLGCLIDPAVYYGSREVDIAMTKLFGGFDESFIDAYNTVWPLENGWEERLSIYNLYPLLVHANLFGSAYVSQILQILKRFS